jgi:hypothetical protein
MRKIITFCLLSCLIANVMLAAQAASRRNPSYNSTAATPDDSTLSADQLDNLLAPIALYPDPLLAQALPASTFVDQVVEAATWLRGNNDNSEGVDNQSWDVSVKSIAHYPSVVYMMSDKQDWTTALGQAYVTQSTDVVTSVQRLRARAKAAGTLVSGSQQKVVMDAQYIQIVPAQPQVIYVPTYDPQVVYVRQSGPSTGAVLVAFGAGLVIGAWLNNGLNWHTHSVYYHGWVGGGWVGSSRTYVHVNNSYYVNTRYRNVSVNRTVVNRNVNYNNVNRYNSVSRDVNYNNVHRNNVNVNNVNKNTVNKNTVNKNTVNKNTVNKNTVNRNNVNKNTVNRNDVNKNTVNKDNARRNTTTGNPARTATPKTGKATATTTQRSQANTGARNKSGGAPKTGRKKP